MTAYSPAWLSPPCGGSHSPAHSHYDTSFRTVHTWMLPYLEFKGLLGHWSLLPELAMARTYPPLGWKGGRDVITSCDRFYTYKGSHETVVNIAPVELQKKFCYAGIRAHVALFIVKVLLWASSRTKTSVSSECITHVIPAHMPSMENHTCISFFVTELYLRNRVSLCGGV